MGMMKQGTEKTVREAVALAYNTESGGAPVITALGRGLIAEKMLQKAMEHDIPVVADALLAQALNQMELGDEIPREFYAIVAEILVMVSRMDGEYLQVHGNKAE